MTPSPFHQHNSDLLDALLSSAVSAEDIAAVQAQLGRYPRGMVAVGARCVCGQPLVTVTRPLLDGGIPFPTTFYLSAPVATKAISRLEASGIMTDLTDQVRTDLETKAAYGRAHLAYLDFRRQLALRLGDSEDHIEGVSAGGMPERVKCLHALVAQSLAMGPGVNPIGDKALDMAKDEFDPAVCRCPQGRDDARSHEGESWL
ncbi:hypothetical protein A200_05502 [Parascardovia denticolens IPLA 20019]|uniref:DUF501 domain-containing protein n=1 Tax=Parascardovia denticolens TaxID=78258 RepID=UPI000266A968|nr:DUF501 domain-containing protein [Parascardovia denticolens]EIT88006.1 hypothetical protein A200_05502 [Parascardovia denticolens IPLA 20019]